jgi:single-strand DNA-binding protein
MKQITIAGGLTRDATVRRTQAGDAILGFSVGVSEGRDKPSTYFDCSLFGKRGEALAQYLTKGTKVTVCGDLSTREHEGKTYLQVRADQITLQGGGHRDDSAGGGYKPDRGSSHDPADDLSSIPF